MSFPIVGIGASAGGLESISALLVGIPASTGMAYVYVQHLDPGRASHLAKILSSRAALPVEEAREGEIFPDHLYVIVPNITLTITSDVLHLRRRDPAERPHRPVDNLFRSLLRAEGRMLLALSSLGASPTERKVSKQSKRPVGLLSRREKNASFFGMPSNAIRTGCVDFILNPCDIARRLTDVSRP
jgi:two-component system, chemotaxis family, CheB/CheR fusion protein